MICYVAVRPLKLNGKDFPKDEPLTSADIGSKVLEKRLLNIHKIAPDPGYANGVQKYVVVTGRGLIYAGKQYVYGDTITSAEIDNPVRERQMVGNRKIAPVYDELPDIVTEELPDENTDKTPGVTSLAFEPHEAKRRGRPRRARQK